MATYVKLSRKSGTRYKAVIRHHRKVLITKTFHRKTDAQKWAGSIEHDPEQMSALINGGSQRPSNVANLIEKYLVAPEHKKKDRSSIQRLRWWSDQIGKTPLTGINKRLIEGKRAVFEKQDRSPATSNRYLMALSGVLTYAVKQEWLLRNPVGSMDKRREGNIRVRFLFDDERTRLLKAARASGWDKLYLLVLMATHTGARKSEMLWLDWTDIDFKQRTATLHTTKNGEPLVLTLTKPVITELMKFRRPSGLVFEHHAMPGKPYNIERTWHDALTVAEIDNFRFHDLRHDAASYLIRNGASLYDVANILGHKDINVTKRYAHLVTEYKQKLTDRVFERQVSAEVLG